MEQINKTILYLGEIVLSLEALSQASITLQETLVIAPSTIPYYLEHGCPSRLSALRLISCFLLFSICRAMQLP